MTLADSIRHAREQKGLTQKTVAHVMGISQQAYSQYESGKRIPKAETLVRIADALGIAPIELLKSSDDSFVPDELELIAQGTILELQNTIAQTVPELVSAAVSATPSFEDLLLHSFHQLNHDGQKKAVERVQELTEVPKYRADSPKQAPPQTSPSTPDTDPTNE